MSRAYARIDWSYGLMVACPFCHAARGVRCRTASGDLTAQFPHGIRVRLAEGKSLDLYPVVLYPAELALPCDGCGEPPRRYGGAVVQPHKPDCARDAQGGV